MEEASPVKPSVAELAGKFKGHAHPMPVTEERKHVRKPPCSLQLHNQTDGESKQGKPAVVPPPPHKGKLKSSPLIEKLQANLALTPTTLLPSPKSPETKLQPAPFCPISPCGSLSPTLRSPQQPGEDEVPVSFEQPAEGTPLPNINKSRVRLSFKRRPPTRQHRKSAGEEMVVDTHERSTSPCAPHSPDKNGEVFSAPQEKKEEDLQDATVVTDQSTDPQEGHSGGVSQDNGGTKVTQGKEEGEVTVAEGSDKPQPTNPAEIQQEEKPSEEQSPEEMEGVEEGGELLPTEENGELKEKTSED
ncbi:capZ-interacting protein isoform X1 [Colossoma macropomum]|uniref:capZ-interacting protein isoform X1 n=1 Tax=Colossoma macropomum TaxID=42526 RepID=UPI001864CA72|nr:capZ-interacting protein isoform X1 [Colossoma macropomum]